MANADKTIGIFPETGTSGYPRIEFTGSGNIPITIEALNDNSLNFKSSLNPSILRIYASGTVSVPNSGSLLVANYSTINTSDILDGGNC
jgi:hypothetical protein